MNFLIKIKISNFLKCAGDEAQSKPSDQIAINERNEVMWQREKRLIAREISALDFHLKREGTWRSGISLQISIYTI